MSTAYGFFGDLYFSAAEYHLLRRAHLGLVRDDLWPDGACDGVPVWCFAGYDTLVTNMSWMDVRVLFLLQGLNYEVSGSEESRKAFVAFATAVAEHYRGRGVIYELWGEPDGDWSWHPRSNPEEYAFLASETIAAMKEADPDAIILGPNVSTLDTVFGDHSWRFLKSVGDAGVLTKFDAVNVHLHTGGPPESQIKNLLRLRRLVDSYSPNHKVPITSSEWGYTTGGEFYRFRATEEQQTQFIVRSWLVNIAHEINLSIWYDWKDDTEGRIEEYGRQFGILTGEGEPKPAYEAVKTLTTTLDGYQFVRRIATDSSDDYFLLFRKNGSGILVAWTASKPHDLAFRDVHSAIESINMLGNSEVLQPNGDELLVQLSESPRYLLLPDGNVGSESVFWKPEGTFFRLDAEGGGEIPVTIDNPSGQQQTYDLQAILNGEPTGNRQVQVGPGETLTTGIPVRLRPQSSTVDFLVKLAITSGETTQTAWVWLQK